MKKYIKILTVLLLLSALSGVNAQVLEAKGSTESIDPVIPKNSGTDVEAGIFVDYMGKLLFWVQDQKTGDPIEGASIELWITSLDRYVLFGLTDEEGCYEANIAYAESGKNYKEQYSLDGTKFTGVFLRFSNDDIVKWKVYKSGWMKYPTEGVIEKLNTFPKRDPVTKKEIWVHEVFVKLYKETKEPDTEIESPDEETESETNPGIYRLPETGVDTQFLCWGIGLLMSLVISVFLIVQLNRNKQGEEKNTL